MLRVVGISDMYISCDPSDVIITYSLGSCLGLMAYDPAMKVGGMLHCMLPLSKIDPVKAQTKPCMFTDTGVTLLLQELFNHGAKRSNLVVKVAGAASMLDEQGLFKIGERNYTVLRKVLWKNSILIAAEDVAGTASRTVALYMDTGRTTMKVAAGKEVEL